MLPLRRSRQQAADINVYVAADYNARYCNDLDSQSAKRTREQITPSRGAARSSIENIQYSSSQMGRRREQT